MLVSISFHFNFIFHKVLHSRITDPNKTIFHANHAKLKRQNTRKRQLTFCYIRRREGVNVSGTDVDPLACRRTAFWCQRGTILGYQHH